MGTSAGLQSQEPHLYRDTVVLVNALGISVAVYSDMTIWLYNMWKRESVVRSKTQL